MINWEKYFGLFCVGLITASIVNMGFYAFPRGFNSIMPRLIEIEKEVESLRVAHPIALYQSVVFKPKKKWYKKYKNFLQIGNKVSQ